MKVLKQHEFVRKSVGGRKHDWATLLDGQIRQLSQEDMGDSKPSTFVGQARTQAKKRNLGIRSQATEDGSVILQAVPAAEGNGAPSKAKAKK